MLASYSEATLPWRLKAPGQGEADGMFNSFWIHPIHFLDSPRVSCRPVTSSPCHLRHSPYRFRPYFSWLDTQSDDEMAAASEISPASTTPAMISANFLTFPLP